MEARAQARYVRVTPMKARRVINLIRGMNASDAQAVLTFAPQAASEPVGKVLASAIANATNNHAMDARGLTVSAAFVDEGPTMKRIRPRAQGRAYRVRKRSSHITVIVSDGIEAVAVAKAAKKLAPAMPADKKGASPKADKAPVESAKKAPAKNAAAKKSSAKKSPASKADAPVDPEGKAPAKKAAAKKTTAKSTTASTTATKKG